MIMHIFKRVSLLLAGIIISLLCLTVVARAQESDKDKIARAEERRKMIQEAKDKLDGTIWQIKLRQTAPKKKEEEDTLRFENYKVASDKMVSEGFAPSNYTVRLKGKDNEIVIWETMQTSEKEGIAFWRGEIQQRGEIEQIDVMRGVLSWHLGEKDKKDYTFVSVEKEVIPEPVEEEISKEETVPAVEAVPAVEEEEEKPKEEPADAEEQEVKKVKPKTEETAKEEEEKKPKRKKREWFR